MACLDLNNAINQFMNTDFWGFECIREMLDKSAFNFWCLVLSFFEIVDEVYKF